jgi:hypothetical protein
MANVRHMPFSTPAIFPSAVGIRGMRLLNLKSCPVPARASPAPSADGESQAVQACHQGKACGIDGTGVFEWGADLLLYLWIPELGGRLVPFSLITVMATEHEV